MKNRGVWIKSVIAGLIISIIASIFYYITFGLMFPFKINVLLLITSIILVSPAMILAIGLEFLFRLAIPSSMLLNTFMILLASLIIWTLFIYFMTHFYITWRKNKRNKKYLYYFIIALTIFLLLALIGEILTGEVLDVLKYTQIAKI